MSRRKDRFRQPASADASPIPIDDIEGDDAEEADVMPASPPPPFTQPVEAPVKLDLETLHAVPAAPPRIGLLAAINAEITAAERAHAFAVAGPLHVAAHAMTELAAALPAACAALPECDLAARLASLAADLS